MSGVTSLGDPLLRIENLRTYLPLDSGAVKAVDGVNLELHHGEIIGIVGESGSGKSMTGLSILKLLPSRKWKSEGCIAFRGEDLLRKQEREMRSYRGSKISMIFQNALTALDPFFTVGDQLAEVIRFHERVTKSEAQRRAVEALDIVGIREPDKRYSSYPHELSGGQRQRVVIAAALACRPDLLIADEPTTALDATVQAQITDLLVRLNRELGTSILMITHDFGVVSKMCDQVAVMYGGRVVEYGRTETVLRTPQHPYTSGLIQSVPRARAPQSRDMKDKADLSKIHRKRLFQIPGTAPSRMNSPAGCAFAPRCQEATEHCLSTYPKQTYFSSDHWASCHQRTTNRREVSAYVRNSADTRG